MEPTPFPLPSKNEALIEFLETRRSNMAKMMTGPGPGPDELDQILRIGARVPDHRKLAPWRFIIFSDEARNTIGESLGRVFKQNNPDLPDRVEFETQRFLRAPIIIGVVSSPVACPRGTPEWEQRQSAAIVCYNLCLAAQGLGYGAQWLTEWYSYDEEIAAELGLKASEKMAGFIYMGTPKVQSMPRPRPKIADKTEYYS